LTDTDGSARFFVDENDKTTGFALEMGWAELDMGD
jgi:hypothetical protein